jgi:WD40 repeat protein
VTSIDWKKMQNGKDYFVSCSDDNTIRVYLQDPNNKNQLELSYVLNTYFITDWHTLTYLALESNGTHLAVVSENGYLFVWDVET